MKVWQWIVLLLVAVVVVTYFSGPRVPEPTFTATFPTVPSDLAELQRYVADKEAGFPTRPDNEARIRFHNDSLARTEYAIVYLHGYGGSYRDGYPANVALADTLGANLYLARWAGHGLVADHAMEGFTPEAAWENAKEALAIGQSLGEKVLILSTSTGGTLAIKLAADYPDRVHALLNMGPNLEDDVPGAWLLDSPWGYELAHLAGMGEHKKIDHEEPAANQYFDTIYPSKALVDLQVLVGNTMTDETFRRVRCPVLTLYYHKDEFNEDQHVELDAYPDAHALFAGSQGQGRVVLQALPDPETHFIGSEIKSKDVDGTVEALVEFCRGL